MAFILALTCMPRGLKLFFSKVDLGVEMKSDEKVVLTKKLAIILKFQKWCGNKYYLKLYAHNLIFYESEFPLITLYTHLM